ncbi:HD domain-containing protein [Hymenobacter taeanensis]|uniref:HD domain-containing protein n=1 Tax=Hymenobacter taeanensis TaxID=2735321 RepID=A0A6M6BKT4_9BACT|nr:MULTISPECIES: HD domain-containing protein [Hymenobacter]QJX48444.1 HD domain-containing protein [Hymenobacter taeanensis]UOQ82063.1 HD domain-containing protein [Hymenobacter sp. 5414T-23]
MNKKKIFNDPVYGFVTIPTELLFDLIEHSYFQRLRRIQQLGLTMFVYPGALHTRFHHALGAMHLMTLALRTLKDKGIKISAKEGEAAMAAILLHDIGHGPLSHALERSIFHEVHHEELSLHLMRKLNAEHHGALDLAIKIFEGTYSRPFFHQLVSSQLDMDRLDYLNRDSFYTGVQEGRPGADRLIKMLTVVDERLVLEEKAVYSIENFLVSRRLMYWQVYLHKTVTSAEQMVIRIMQRARDLVRAGHNVPASPALHYFLSRNVSQKEFEQDDQILRRFTRLDDTDVWSAVKLWADHPDTVLNYLAQSLLDRHLFKISLQTEPFEEEFKLGIIELIAEHFRLPHEEAAQLMIAGRISNNAYDADGKDTIDVLTKRGKVVNVAEASDLPNIKALGQRVEKHYICYPKEIL